MEKRVSHWFFGGNGGRNETIHGFFGLLSTTYLDTHIRTNEEGSIQGTRMASLKIGHHGC